MGNTYYKWLREDGSAIYGTGSWHLPTDNGPGEWMPHIEDIEPCKSGYHLCRQQDLVKWHGPSLYVSEARGEVLECDGKVIVHEARLVRRVEAWDERTSRLFAADCAERVLPIFESACPGDDRPRNAIEVALRYAHGQATKDDLYAADDAAQAASWVARDATGGARDAARAAARATTMPAAWAATTDATDAAAQAAAKAASDATGGGRAAARAAEREWQTQHLLEMLEVECDG
ncbi:MAG: hypothetical protein GF320_21880 [Armatimonadia bacterium]|nr:hypothetical protein [Armatimonadia bacterium]